MREDGYSLGLLLLTTMRDRAETLLTRARGYGRPAPPSGWTQAVESKSARLGHCAMRIDGAWAGFSSSGVHSSSSFVLACITRKQKAEVETDPDCQTQVKASGRTVGLGFKSRERVVGEKMCRRRRKGWGERMDAMRGTERGVHSEREREKSVHLKSLRAAVLERAPRPCIPAPTTA